MARRDTFNDFITDEDLVEAGYSLIDHRVSELAHRSGVANVTSGIIRIEDHPIADAVVLRATFSASAWTGRF